MDNLPPSYSDWMTDSGIHESECDDQPMGYPCVCDHIADQRFEDSVEVQIEMGLGN